MTYIQEVLVNAIMIERLIDALTPEDLETKEGRKMFRFLKRQEKKFKGAVTAYEYLSGDNG